MMRTIAMTMIVGAAAGLVAAKAQTAAPPPPDAALTARYCVTCHNDRRRTGGLTLQNRELANVGADADTWEKVVRKLRTGVMPPAGMPRPSRTDAEAFVASLEAALDRAAADHPDPGRPAVHRLNRVEYSNAIRDLLAVNVDVASLLPPDNSALGFDNVAEVLSVSPSLLERYMSAARQISRLALGDPAPRVTVYAVPRDLDQDERVGEDLPLGSRGGLAVRHYFPVDGEYAFKVQLHRNVMEEIRGLADVHQIDLRIDGERIKLFTIGGEQPEAGKDSVPSVHLAITTYLIGADHDLEARIPIKAGEHLVTATVLGQRVKAEGPPQPPIVPKSTDGFQGRNTGFGIGRVEVRGPEHASGAGDTPSRRRILICHPVGASREAACGRQILTTIARRAFRRPLTPADRQELEAAYQSGRQTGGFEAGIDLGLRRILMSPYFLFRVEQDPAGAAPNAAYRLSDLELASRLSFFLWSSIPDDQLLEAAVRGKLKDPAVFEQQVTRMLRDPRASALLSNFAGQWLEVRNLALITPDEDTFSSFDDNLRKAFKQETDLFLESILREDRSVLDLLTADYTFVNERLARFYGIPGVYGDRFRRVTWSDAQHARAGVLGQGSVLAVTSYATRTSPVLRGKWILANLLGAPPQPPPPNIPTLQEKGSDGKPRSMRAAIEEHRKNPACAGCHARMDPLGFALENFDAIGHFRTVSESKEPVDASGALPDGTPFDGPAGLRQALLGQRGNFVETMTEKLLTYAVGRGVEAADMPSVRAIVRDAAAKDYRFSAIVLGIARSVPFQMRRSAARLTEPAGAQ